MGEAGGGSGGIRFLPSALPSSPGFSPPDRRRAGHHRNGVLCRKRPSLRVNHCVTPRTSAPAFSCATGRAERSAMAVGRWQEAALRLLVCEPVGRAAHSGDAGGAQAYDGSGG